MLEKNTLSGKIKVHYELIRNNQDQVIDKLNTRMGFYTFRPIDKIKEHEVMFDTRDNHLSSVGIILSRQIANGKYFFKIRKVSHIQSSFNKPIVKFEISNAKKNVTPNSFASQIAQTIQDFFANAFGIDLTDVIKRVTPKIEVKTSADVYEIVSGTGFKGEMMFQKIIYKDLETKRKVKNREVEISYPSGLEYEKERDDILNGIEKYCKELLPYKESRFEIARNYLKIREKKPVQKKEKKQKEKKD